MRFLLVHGSCHGAWCWRDVLPHMAGHEVRAIDLPGHGADATPVGDVTLDMYADAILAACDGPTVVVGHSMAGFPISLAAEKAPEKVAKLIYVCAYLPVSGMSLADMRRAGPRQPLLDAIIADGPAFRFDPAKIEDRLYHDCTHALDYARENLGPQPILPQNTAITLGDAFAATPKRYILCTEDRAIPPEYQAMMSGGLEHVRQMRCSHSPFFAAPQELARNLIQLAEA